MSWALLFQQPTLLSILIVFLFKAIVFCNQKQFLAIKVCFLNH